MNKYILIVLVTISLLTIIKNADTCTTYTTEDTCKAGTNCEWKATGKCKGDSGTTCSKVTVQSTCGTTTYSGKVNCVYVEASSAGTCSGTATDTSKTCSTFSTKDTCPAGCTFAPTTAASCGTDSSCTSKASSKETCEATTYDSASINCVWEVGTCATKAAENTNPSDSSFGLKLSGLIYFLLTLF